MEDLSLTFGSAFWHEKLMPAVEAIKTTLDKYPKGSVALSFNGGKDCTTLLDLCELCCKEDLFIVVFKEADSFPELESFINSRLAQTPFKVIWMEESIKSGMETLVRRGLQAVIMGQRKGDPYCPSSVCSPSTAGWPEFIRINPILEWSYSDVWHFLISNKSEYCCLYDCGYTSLGPKSHTSPNPFLNGRPAWMLEKQDSERIGRD